jgi:pantoate--beta-alanine ligase
MEILRAISRMQMVVRRWQRAGIRIALVPTMGYLHGGHVSLLRRARAAVGRGGKVVVSVYVNPTQFGPKEDFSRYPRDFRRDAAICRKEKADVVFAPADEEMYPRNGEGAFSTYVVEEVLSRGMEGASRPGHFRGVTTVVAKLFNIVQPQVAVFGAKDYQQATIVKRMTRDLNFPVKIVVAPTFREGDGLAMSSRNKYLKGDLRRQAAVLSRAIAEVSRAVRESGKPLRASTLKRQVKRLVERERAARLDYVEFFDPVTLATARLTGQGTHMALAVYVGGTRLIDNGRL